jgi:predicted nucleotidyltransferase
MTAEVRTEMHDKRDIPQEVLDMAQRLVEAFHPERIYLFGSFARGDTTPDSDYDLMMIVPDSDLPPYRRSQEAHRALFDFHYAKDILVWTHDEFERRVHLAASLPATILREGILVYGP